ncbi:MAG: EAL domain-containing protein [Spirochaetaceae bacterium]|nr:EAL domain-containing protein [Spirochaetaceae bacterium]
MSMKDKLKKFLGLEKYSSYINKYFDSSNIRSAVYVSSVIIVLEITMILITIIRQQIESTRRSTEWFIQHFTMYVLLLAVALVLFIYSIRHIKKISTNRVKWEIIRYLFSAVAIVFGIYISFLDYGKGEQFINLMTMTVLIFCFIAWRPIFSIVFLSGTYILFFILCEVVKPTSYATQVNLAIVFIVILMSAINSFHQKLHEAQKDEKLEHTQGILLKLSISDEVTGLANMNYFRGQALSVINDKKNDPTSYVFLFFDVENFKALNEKYGFWEGNTFLKNFADNISNIFNDSVVAHFSNDNFVVLTKNESISEKIELLHKNLSDMKYDLKLGLKVGGYRPENRECLPLVACDHARYACYSIKKLYNKIYCEYDETMASDFKKKQYIINNIDNAIKNEYIKVYYQPVINAQNGKVCGVEALSRWDDPTFGFLSPADFIQTLEEYHQIHKLDMYVVETVCKMLSKVPGTDFPLLPVSLNFSRLDFDSINLAEEVENCLQKYNIDKESIHIEITESTLSQNDASLKEAFSKFRNSGYALWLDDFGSGYSGLNVLKEYDFDVMKIDMKFLENFSENPKAHRILRNVIALAKELGMKTLTEGVETEEAYQFLKEAGCEQLQGYLFGKPMPDTEIYEKIKNGTYQIDDCYMTL